MIKASASVVIEASVEVAAHPGKVLTRKAASESSYRARKMATAKPATHTSATEPATHTSTTEPAAHTSTSEPAVNMSAPESSAVSTAATVSTATSAARERVNGQSPGESGSHSENDHGLP
jgi:hypothetical protein